MEAATAPALFGGSAENRKAKEQLMKKAIKPARAKTPMKSKKPSCVRQVQQKDLRYVGPRKAVGAERSPWREFSGAPGGGLGSLPHHEFFVFAKFLHIEITKLLEPVLMRLDCQGAD
jgi:hypothetical protein